jgi:hypothetical protein
MLNELDAHEIVPGLWQGSLPPSGSAVADAGFDVLVLCARDYQRPADDYPGVEIIYAPNNDSAWSRPKGKDMAIASWAARKVVTAVQDGSRVLVTCFAGINRSALVVALAIHGLHGYSGPACIQLIREKRKLAHPTDQALTNDYFVEALLRLPGRRVTPGAATTTGDAGF